MKNYGEWYSQVDFSFAWRPVSSLPMFWWHELHLQVLYHIWSFDVDQTPCMNSISLEDIGSATSTYQQASIRVVYRIEYFSSTKCNLHTVEHLIICMTFGLASQYCILHSTMWPRYALWDTVYMGFLHACNSVIFTSHTWMDTIARNFPILRLY